jgi:hypothetical protein
VATSRAGSQGRQFDEPGAVRRNGLEPHRHRQRQARLPAATGARDREQPMLAQPRGRPDLALAAHEPVSRIGGCP